MQTDSTRTTKDGFTIGDECGDPGTYSQLWWTREGTVTQVLDADRVRLEQDTYRGNPESAIITVKLVGIDKSVNAKAVKNFLVAKILNQRVTVTGNVRKESDTSMSGILALRSKYPDINEVLIEEGLAKFKNFDLGYLIPYNKACQMQNAEERARSAKRGIWQQK